MEVGTMPKGTWPYSFQTLTVLHNLRVCIWVSDHSDKTKQTTTRALLAQPPQPSHLRKTPHFWMQNFWKAELSTPSQQGPSSRPHSSLKEPGNFSFSVTGNCYSKTVLGEQLDHSQTSHLLFPLQYSFYNLITLLLVQHFHCVLSLSETILFRIVAQYLFERNLHSNQWARG